MYRQCILIFVASLKVGRDMYLFMRPTKSVSLSRVISEKQQLTMHSAVLRLADKEMMPLTLFCTRLKIVNYFPD